MKEKLYAEGNIVEPKQSPCDLHYLYYHYQFYQSCFIYHDYNFRNVLKLENLIWYTWWLYIFFWTSGKRNKKDDVNEQ